jgi:hypothetical protein
MLKGEEENIRERDIDDIIGFSLGIGIITRYREKRGC